MTIVSTDGIEFPSSSSEDTWKEGRMTVRRRFIKESENA